MIDEREEKRLASTVAGLVPKSALSSSAAHNLLESYVLFAEGSIEEKAGRSSICTLYIHKTDEPKHEYKHRNPQFYFKTHLIV